jgi:hypothetical protein
VGDALTIGRMLSAWRYAELACRLVRFSPRAVNLTEGDGQTMTMGAPTAPGGQCIFEAISFLSHLLTNFAKLRL